MRRYAVVLMVLVGTSLPGVFLLHRHATELIAADARLIDRSGRQRMLCERIARSFYALALDAESDERDLLRAQLESDLSNWTLSQRALLAPEAELGLSAAGDSEIERLLTEIEPHRVFIAETARWALEVGANGAPPAEFARRITGLRAAAAAFVVGMDGVVAYYEHHAQTRVDRIEALVGGLCAFALGLMTFTYLMFRRTALESAERGRAEASLARSARRAAILQRTTAVTAEVANLEDALQACLDNICELSGWPVGHVYLPTPDGEDLLVPSAIWHLDDPAAYAAFREATENTRVARGEGLPGRILATGRAEWFVDVQREPNFPRAREAGEIGLHAAFGFPVKIEDSIVAVLEVFATERRALDEDLCVIADDIGVHLGRVVERRRAALAVRENELRLRAIFEAVLDAIVTIDHRGIVQSVNGAVERLFGYEPSELLGRNVSALMPEPHRSKHDAYIQRYVQGGKARVIGSGREVVAERKDGTPIPVELSLSELQLPGQRQFVGVLRDIRERRRVQQLKDEFISTVSHELRTPLTSIRGSLGLVLGGAVGEVAGEARDLIDIAARNTDRLGRLINDILDIEKIEAGKMEFEVGPVSLGETLAEAIAVNQSFADAYGVEYVLESIGSIRVMADAARLMQVLTNLLSNAAKFSPAGSQVKIAAALSDQMARISVTDQGPGIPEEFREKVFEKFTQADDVSTRRVGGTGLGLSICKVIVEQLGGSIGFDTEIGRGTTFFIELPLTVEAPQSGAEPLPAGQAREGEGDRERRRVLVCEDDPDIARMLTAMLGQKGYACDVAHSAARARELLHKARYKAITLDLTLSDSDGIGFLRELRGDPETAELAIIVVSASADESRAELNGDAVEIVDWIQKPIDEKRLLAAVALGCRRSRSELPRILHVEDDSDLRQVVVALVGQRAEVVGVGTLGAAYAALRAGSFDLAILDISLPDGSGLALLDEIEPEVPVIVFSAQEMPADPGELIADMLLKSEASPERLLEVIASLLGPSREA